MKQHRSIEGLINLPWDQGQRWRDGRDSYRPADDERFEPSKHEVVLLPGDGDVAPFVVKHHYARSCPNSGRFRFGLFDTSRPSWGENDEGLVGVAVFGSPAGPKVLSSSFPFLGRESSQTAAELQRLVLLDEVLKNAESWFVARCFRELRQHAVEACVSFSDPDAGHVGCVYQALNAHYTGRSKAAWSWYLPGGNKINRRDLTKVQASCPCCGSGASASGAQGAMDRVVSWGAPAPLRGQCRRAWLSAALPRIAARRRHGGNHRFVWGLNKASKRGLRQLHGEIDSSVYPKKDA